MRDTGGRELPTARRAVVYLLICARRVHPNHGYFLFLFAVVISLLRLTCDPQLPFSIFKHLSWLVDCPPPVCIWRAMRTDQCCYRAPLFFFSFFPAVPVVSLIPPLLVRENVNGGGQWLLLGDAIRGNLLCGRRFPRRKADYPSCFSLSSANCCLLGCETHPHLT